MDAILLAGGTCRTDDPLYPLTVDGHKSLIPLGGKPVAQWTLDAMNAADCVERVVIVGLPEGAAVDCPKCAARLADHGGVLENMVAGAKALMQWRSPQENCISVSADIPAIRPEIIAWLAERMGESEEDLYYTVVQRQVMEARYPGSRRTYLRLKGAEVCGGDLNGFRLGLALDDQPMAARLVATRKNPLKQAALIGLDTLALVLLGRLDLEGAVRRVAQRMGMRGRAILSPYAELGMDIDKIGQYELMRQDLLRLETGEI